MRTRTIGGCVGPVCSALRERARPVLATRWPGTLWRSCSCCPLGRQGCAGPSPHSTFGSAKLIRGLGRPRDHTRASATHLLPPPDGCRLDFPQVPPKAAARAPAEGGWCLARVSVSQLALRQWLHPLSEAPSLLFMRRFLTETRLLVITSASLQTHSHT